MDVMNNDNAEEAEAEKKRKRGVYFVLFIGFVYLWA